jgi:CDP-diacylglycerol--serine O-phosphatidyltransferase
MKPLRTIAVLPTMFTLGNLVCGFFAIVVAARVSAPTLPAEIAPADLDDVPAVASPAARTKPLPETSREDLENVMFSGWLIFIAMLFDALDGHVARLSRTSSDFGAQLDSLCDVVSFGVAPGFLLVKMCPRFAFLHKEAVWIIAASFAACAALRLARFNVETGDEDEHLYFSGLPSPAAAGSIAGFAIVFLTLMGYGGLRPPPYADTIYAVLQTVLPFYAILVALLMVSRIPYPHVVNQVFRGERSFSHVVKLVFALVAVMVIRGYAVPIVFCVFVLGSPLRFAWERIVRRRHQEEPVF